MRIGITGGIGSGKTTVCRIFESLGIPVFYADDEAKAAYKDPAIIKELKKVLGEKPFSSGKADLRFIAQLIFTEKEKREALNRIIHPYVREKYRAWEAQQLQSAPYTLREAAILIESGAYKDCDKIIIVEAPEEIRVQRVMQRDSAEEETVRKRIQAQLSDAQRKEYADYIIVNDGNKALIPQVIKVHNEIMKLRG